MAVNISWTRIEATRVDAKFGPNKQTVVTFRLFLSSFLGFFSLCLVPAYHFLLKIFFC